MSGSLCLNGTWGLTYSEDDPSYYTRTIFAGRQLLPAAVPAPVHQVLLDAGVIDDPNIGINSLKARWVEEQIWIYRHTFLVPNEALLQTAWLTFACLEMDAVIYLNGEEIGRHANAFRPARFNVTGKLRDGENLLVVRIESGLFAASERPVERYMGGNTLGSMTKRHWHRKAQYQCGWDWQERMMNVGILGDVHLEWRNTPRLDQVTVFAAPSDDLRRATVHVRATIEGLADTAPARLCARILETGQTCEIDFTLDRGDSRHELTLDIENPQLWWPIHHGTQNRYTVDVTLETAGDMQQATRKVGVRKVEIDQSPHPVEGRYFILRINDRPIFCKGGNWVPADQLYSAVTPERTRELVDLAVQANFNMFRVWGGGVYADQTLCDACDAAGILIWHDFHFSCAKYPFDDIDFAREVHREVTHVVRELAHHPSIFLWCGNNEIQMAHFTENYDPALHSHPLFAMFHQAFPQIVAEENPATLYWPGSPFSPDYKRPNDPTAGDQHPWGVTLGTAGGSDWWDYRQYVDRFANEGGVFGASSPATLRQFLPENERYQLSLCWDHHDNPFALRDPRKGGVGHAYQTVELWCGLDPFALDWERYAVISALTQAEGLTEYISNYRRRMFSSACAVFWMYNDSWPVTHGWTIVDYYRRKKLAYHPVRRAFQPVTVVVAEEGGVVTVYGVNDTPQDWTGEVRYGLFTLAGGMPKDEMQTVTLAANASTPLASFNNDEWEALGLTQSGVFATLTHAGILIAQHRLFHERFKDLQFADPVIAMRIEDGMLTLTSEVFVWGVCLDVDGEQPLADNCFDLLPGIPYTLPWQESLGEPKIVFIASRDAVIQQSMPVTG